MPLSVSSQKSQLRSRIRILLRSMGARGRKLRSRKISEKLFKTAGFKKAEKLFIYASLPEEVGTFEIMAKALRRNKKVFVPKVSGSGRKIKVFEVRDLRADLSRGSFGILEPQTKRPLGRQSLDLMIIPGLAFDRKGNRLGRGKGYFDRFLTRFKKTPKIGLAFKEQIVSKVPAEAHDISVDKVIVG